MENNVMLICFLFVCFLLLFLHLLVSHIHKKECDQVCGAIYSNQEYKHECTLRFQVTTDYACRRE